MPALFTRQRKYALRFVVRISANAETENFRGRQLSLDDCRARKVCFAPHFSIHPHGAATDAKRRRFPQAQEFERHHHPIARGANVELSSFRA